MGFEVGVQVLDEVLWGHDTRYGGAAVGDGSTDAYAAIQGKLDQARLIGGEVKLQPGTYSVSATLQPHSAAGQNPVKLTSAGPIGAGLNPSLPVAITRPAGTTHTLIRALGKGFWMQGLCLNGKGTAGMLLQVDRGFELRLEHIIAYNCLHHGLLLKALSNPQLSHLHVEKCGAVTVTGTGAVTALASTVTASAGIFVATDVGKILEIAGAGVAGVVHASEITGFTSATVVTIRTPAVTTVGAGALTMRAAAVRITGNTVTSTESTSNTVAFDEVHLERNAGVDLDIAYGSDVDTLAEFLRFTNLHIESMNDNIPGVYKTDPLIRVGNVRGVDFASPFLYGGQGTLLSYEKLQGITAAGAADGVKLLGGYLFGIASATALQTPVRLVDLVTGSGFESFGTEFDTAMTEHIRVRSTFGKRAWVVGPNHKTRTGATTTYLTDDRTDDTTNREQAPMPPAVFDGDMTVRSAAATRLMAVDTPAAIRGGFSWLTAGLQRWRWIKNTTAESGTNNGGDLALEAYADDGSTLLFTYLVLIRKSARSVWSGPHSFKRRTYTVSATLSLNDHIVAVVDSSSSPTFTLPSCASHGGELRIVDESNGSGTFPITIVRAGSDTYWDGTTSKTINTNGGVLALYSNGGTKWMKAS